MYTRAAPHTSVPDTRASAQEASAMSVSRGVEWGVLLGMRKIETVEQMPEEYRQVILKLLSALASTEFASVGTAPPLDQQGADGGGSLYPGTGRGRRGASRLHRLPLNRIIPALSLLFRRWEKSIDYTRRPISRSIDAISNRNPDSRFL